ncbi:hypothetical protein A3D00_05000 [Candidatus Woesebacteria bacterium RIFCSPHIGHO2_02_FULL_38_9]|uniref:Glycosyl transferase family 1 domain-containing protein n=1 Tax=Candidatus Woesebacteria bacterium RIFCSPHIGHO2_01_FULL_39_28 TaxID=1802496 RepID=A0A1F7YC46_9BACT|nr:MAG: hypothetical protein A2627_02930 [Candidatus Woesebacteria bacterium RIFCSPHIGHO2_01_FULL_39_28]OGM32347.1 MAG: hypothetical protein A3D00_05000 [Candidatus Woesebacteria bacterium RIFCSPHIGHO2_02_FULL_38_9]OGM58001.1 MAG: hypothetical protein A3A50_01940 [Candidatus Woesebacteria bacterium RIFCSPLOWO2_01_FULL_38_20]
MANLPKRVAIVYDRVNKWGGAERVLLVLHEMFPNAPLFTSVYNPRSADWAEVFPKICTSFLQKIPYAREKHEHFPFLMPLVFESFTFNDYDLVISVTSEAAKGIITKPGTLHICYCLTPTRYLWSHFNLYFENPILKFISSPVASYLKTWDRIAAQRPDVMIAISDTVRKRIKKYYYRESKVIFPPVELSTGQHTCLPDGQGGVVRRENFFLVVSRLVPYKKVDLVVESFNELRLPLIVVGTGSEERKLKALAKSNIKFKSQLTDEKLKDYYSRSKALIFAQEEDFGLTAVEAQSFATPVIAYRKGGAKEIIIDGKTGVFFDKQDKKNLIEAIHRFEQIKFDRKVLIQNAKRFSKERFKKEFLDLINKYTIL